MILMIGGAYQGKKDLALQMADGREELVFPDVQEYIREKQLKDRRILFLHTGGAPLFYDFLAKEGAETTC